MITSLEFIDAGLIFQTLALNRSMIGSSSSVNIYLDLISLKQLHNALDQHKVALNVPSKESITNPLSNHPPANVYAMIADGCHRRHWCHSNKEERLLVGESCDQVSFPPFLTLQSIGTLV